MRIRERTTGLIARAGRSYGVISRHSITLPSSAVRRKWDLTMAGEKRGAVAEAIVDIALRAIVGSHPELGSVWCQTPPQGVSIDTDFSVGSSSDTPRFVFLITVSGSIKDSTRKFWRNLAELI